MFGRSAFPSFFDDDPFFRNAFGHMDNMLAGFANDPFFAPHFHQPQRTVPGPRTNTVVEEVEDEEHTRTRGDGTQPIVEEPDDDDEFYDITGQTQQRRQQQQRQQQYQQQSARTSHTPPGAMVGNSSLPGFPFPAFGNTAFPAFGNSNGATVFSVSSSSSYSTGPGGVYSSSTTTRVGPGGVREVQQTIQDGRTGQQRVTVTRGIADKSRTVTRVKDASGRETTNDILNQISADEAADFDRQWMQQAQQALPPNPFGRPSITSFSGRQQTPALPPAGAPIFSPLGSRMGTPSGRGFNP